MYIGAVPDRRKNRNARPIDTGFPIARKMVFQNEGWESMTSLHLLQTTLSLSRIRVWQRTSPQEGRGGVTGRMIRSTSRRESSGSLLIAAAVFLRAWVSKCDGNEAQAWHLRRDRSRLHWLTRVGDGVGMRFVGELARAAFWVVCEWRGAISPNLVNRQECLNPAPVDLCRPLTKEARVFRRNHFPSFGQMDHLAPKPRAANPDRRQRL